MKATFAAGCFWGIEELFRQQPGVISTKVGYIGGQTVNPTYPDVCTGQTGHAEAIEIEYDPEKITYDTLLELFWNNHNPTTPNQQGPDIGTQYRSVIFFHNAEQANKAEHSKALLEKTHRFAQPIITQIIPASTFYLAEDYHQQYAAKRGKACH